MDLIANVTFATNVPGLRSPQCTIASHARRRGAARGTVIANDGVVRNGLKLRTTHHASPGVAGWN
jgi:hypothetical protein